MNKNLGNIVVHIPAREGSKRIKNKNLKKINNKYLISYTIEKAISIFKKTNIFVNSDSKKILKIAKSYGINTYKRKKKYADDKTQGDDFTYDFIQNINCDTLIMLNPVCPLLKKNEIKKAISIFKEKNCDTLISCTSTKMQCFYDNKAINININKPLGPSQKNKDVHTLNWAISIWNTRKFIINYKKNKNAYLGRNRFLFSIENLSGIKISNLEDLKFVKKIISSHNHQ